MRCVLNAVRREPPAFPRGPAHPQVTLLRLLVTLPPMSPTKDPRAIQVIATGEK